MGATYRTHASGFGEALAAGDWERVAAHARALAQLAPPQVMEVSSGGGVHWVPAPPTMTGALWTDLPQDAQRAVLFGLTPIPGLLIGRFLFGLAWPAASATGLLSAPLLLWAAVVLTRRAAQQAAGAPHTTLGPRGR